MLLNASLSDSYWLKALNYAIHLHNISPTIALPTMPTEAYSGTTPNWQHALCPTPFLALHNTAALFTSCITLLANSLSLITSYLTKGAPLCTMSTSSSNLMTLPQSTFSPLLLLLPLLSLLTHPPPCTPSAPLALLIQTTTHTITSYLMATMLTLCMLTCQSP